MALPEDDYKKNSLALPKKKGSAARSAMRHAKSKVSGRNYEKPAPKGGFQLPVMEAPGGGLDTAAMLEFLQSMMQPQEGQIRPMGTTKGIIRRNMDGSLEGGPKGLDFVKEFGPQQRKGEVKARQDELNRTSASQNPAIVQNAKSAVGDLFRSQQASGVRNPDGSTAQGTPATVFDNGSRVMESPYGKGFSVPTAGAQPGVTSVNPLAHSAVDPEVGQFDQNFAQEFQRVANAGYTGAPMTRPGMEPMGPPKPQGTPQAPGFQLPQAPAVAQQQPTAGVQSEESGFMGPPRSLMGTQPTIFPETVQGLPIDTPEGASFGARLAAGLPFYSTAPSQPQATQQSNLQPARQGGWGDLFRGNMEPPWLSDPNYGNFFSWLTAPAVARQKPQMGRAPRAETASSFMGGSAF